MLIKKIYLTRWAVVFVFMLVMLISCDKQSTLKNGEGFIPVTGGKIWYRVTGQGDKTPIVMLHGGPGYPSHYLNALRPLGSDRRIITFDQLGCGRSDAITDTTLMTMDNFVEQVHELVTTLGIKEFHLYGHSWGSMLGVDYYLKYPEGIKSIVLASPCLNSKLWESDSDSLIAMLPDSTELILRNEIKGVKQDSATLAEAMNVYWGTYYFRKQPTSPGLDSTFAQIGWNVYNYMWGSSEYFVQGTLSTYDRTKDLGSIKVPTLYVAGEYDPARPKTLQYYQGLTPNSKASVISNAGHLIMDDNTEECLRALTQFLGEVEK